MKILYVNLLYRVVGHKMLDQNLVNLMGISNDVTVISEKNWYARLSTNIRVSNYEIYPKNNRISRYQNTIKIISYVKNYIKTEKFDIIFLASFDLYTLSIFGRKLLKHNTVLLHHDTVDILKYARYKIFYKFIPKYVNHATFESYIKTYLMNMLKVSEDNCFIINHPISPINNAKLTSNSVFDFVGISNSNDECLIDDIINYEEKTMFFLNNNIKILLKSKNRSFDNGYLKVINNFVSEEEYSQYISGSKAIVMPFSKTFQYRTSGTLMDGLSNRKVIIGSNIMITQEYNLKYPVIVKIFTNIEEFSRICVHISKQNFDTFEFDDFIDKHSDFEISQKINKDFNRIIERNK